MSKKLKDFHRIYNGSQNVSATPKQLQEFYENEDREDDNIADDLETRHQEKVRRSWDEWQG
jgi:hypothetical protein